MARTIGPLMSISASGTIAKTLVFSRWKGRAYVRQHVTPANPRAAGQVGMRSMFSFLAQAWANVIAGSQATWADLADVGNYSTFNAYMKENQASWRDYAAPTSLYPADTSDSAAALGSEAANASGRNILLQGNNAGGTNNWGIAIFRDTSTGFTLNWDKCIAVVPLDDTGVLSYTDGPLDADEYFYNFKNFTLDGQWGIDETEVDAIVT